MFGTLLHSITEILLLLFLIITFLQSGLDKIFHWNGNLNWLKEHFKSSPLQNWVPGLLAIVLFFETAAGFLSLIGLFQILLVGESIVALYGAVLSCIALLMLLFGQRTVQDYEGAKTIVIYFLPAIFLVFLLQH